MKKLFVLAIMLAVSVAAWAQENPETPKPEESPAVVKPKPEETPAAVRPRQSRPDAYREYKAGNYEGAVAICQGEIRDMPNNRDSYVVIGWALVALGRYSEAFDYTRTGIERTGQDNRFTATAEESLTKLYAWFYAQGRLDDAVPAIQRFISYLPASPKVPAAYGLLGDIYLKKGNFIYADTALSYALRSHPASFEWWLGAGQAREKFEDFMGALTAYGEALKQNPSHQEALRGRDRMREKLSLAPSASPAP